MRWRVPAIVVLAAALVGAAFVYLPALGWNNSQTDARQRVAAYLAAVAGGASDRGWDLLEASGRAEYPSQEAYRETMGQADWSTFEWEFGESANCDDGVCTLVLRLPNGRDSAPSVAWSEGLGDPGVLISTEGSTGGAVESGDAYINVLQHGWFGGIGVVVFGASNRG